MDMSNTTTFCSRLGKAGQTGYSLGTQLATKLVVQDNKLEKLIDFVYPDLDAPLDGSVILATKNLDVDEINRIMQERIVGRDSRDYCSADSIGEEGVDAAVFPTEFLNSLVCFYF